MHPGLISEFYTAFSEKNAEKMTNCYHNEIVFTDPAFGTLKGLQAKNMWRMLCESQKNKDFRIQVSDIRNVNNKVFAKWEAFYQYGKKGRKVHNRIEAEFEFKDGLIIKHIDRFNLWKWSIQALGAFGLFAGWTSYFRMKLQTQTKKLLTHFEEKQT